MKRNIMFDGMKTIAALLVVIIHFPLPGEAGRIISNVGKMAVPFFFCISGYYLLNREGTFQLKRKLPKILFLLAIAFLLGIIYHGALYISGDKSIINSLLNVVNWIKFMALNLSIISSATWFLYSLIYVYIIYYFINKWKLYRLAYYAALVLIIVYVGTAVGTALASNSFVFERTYLFRNFFFTGFPFFTLGVYLKQKKEFVQKISNTVIVAMILLGILSTVAELYLLYRNFTNTDGPSLLIGSIILCVGLMFLCIKNGGVKSLLYLDVIGLRYSMYIYIFHMFVGRALSFIFDVFEIEFHELEYISTALVIICSLITATVFDKIVVLSQRYFKRNNEKIVG